MLSSDNAGDNFELLNKLRKALPDLEKSRSFIEQFASTANTVSDILYILKNTGLTAESFKKCCQLSERLDDSTAVKEYLQDWFVRHIEIQQRLTTLPLLVSSDIIESLFGRFKHVIERSPQADMNRTTLSIPALCGKHGKTSIEQSFSQISHSDIAFWEADNIAYTMRKKRQEFFADKIHKMGNVMPC